MQVLRRAIYSRYVHVAQHSSQVTIDVFNLFKPGASKHELDKRVLYEVLRRLSLTGQAQSVREQVLITLGEQLFALLIWLCGHSALIQHLVSELSGSPVGALLDLLSVELGTNSQNGNDASCFRETSFESCLYVYLREADLKQKVG